MKQLVILFTTQRCQDTTLLTKVETVLRRKMCKMLTCEQARKNHRTFSWHFTYFSHELQQ